MGSPLFLSLYNLLILLLQRHPTSLKGKTCPSDAPLAVLAKLLILLYLTSVQIDNTPLTIELLVQLILGSPK